MYRNMRYVRYVATYARFSFIIFVLHKRHTHTHSAIVYGWVKLLGNCIDNDDGEQRRDARAKKYKIVRRNVNQELKEFTVDAKFNVDNVEKYM